MKLNGSEYMVRLAIEYVLFVAPEANRLNSQLFRFVVTAVALPKKSDVVLLVKIQFDTAKAQVEAIPVVAPEKTQWSKVATLLAEVARKSTSARVFPEPLASKIEFVTLIASVVVTRAPCRKRLFAALTPVVRTKWHLSITNESAAVRSAPIVTPVVAAFSMIYKLDKFIEEATPRVGHVTQGPPALGEFIVKFLIVTGERQVDSMETQLEALPVMVIFEL